MFLIRLPVTFKQKQVWQHGGRVKEIALTQKCRDNHIKSQTYQVSRVLRETPAFWSHLPLTSCATKITRISVRSAPGRY